MSICSYCFWDSLLLSILLACWVSVNEEREGGREGGNEDLVCGMDLTGHEERAGKGGE